MVHIHKLRTPEARLYTLARDFFLDAARFPDELSENLRSIFPMKELFVTYVDIAQNKFSFHHGPEVTPETVRFYRQYPLRVLPEDYMARGAFSNPVGTVVIDREAIDETSELDNQVEHRALTETHNGTMALSLLTAPSLFSRFARQQNPFLRNGVVAVTLYGDRYDDYYSKREKRLAEGYMHCLRMGILNSASIAKGTADYPRFKECSVFSVK